MNHRFISFEGIDFSGKSTQITMLKKYIEERGARVYVLREPGGTEISEQIRRILLDHEQNKMESRAEFLMFSSARAQLVSEKIVPLLKQGHFVIADRFVDSSTAYQGAGRGLEQTMVSHINLFATHGILPTCTFYLRLSVEEATRRRRALNKTGDRMETAGEVFYKRVINGYDSIAAKEPERIHIVDARQTINAIQQEIRTVVKSMFLP